MRLLDVGCGWGSMLLHAADATTACEAVGRHAVAPAGRAGREAHRRGRPRRPGRDPASRTTATSTTGRTTPSRSIGMFEHVGAAQPRRVLRPAPRPARARGPAAQPRHRPPARASRPASPAAASSTATSSPTASCTRSARSSPPCRTPGFEVRHVESLREHYALTLRRWVANLEAELGRRRRGGRRRPGPGCGASTWRRRPATSSPGAPASTRCSPSKPDGGRSRLPAPPELLHGAARNVGGVKLPLTPLDFLARARRLFPDRVGVVAGRRRSRFDLRRLRRPLRRPGPAAARRRRRASPATGWPSSPATATSCSRAYYGVLLAGAVLVPLNIRNSAPELAGVPRRLPRRRLLVRDPTLPDPGFAGPTFGLDAWAAGATEPVAGRRRSTRTTRPSSSTRRARPAGPRARCSRTGPSTCTPSTTPSPTASPATTSCCTRSRCSTSTGGARAHFLTGLGGTHVMLPRFDAGEVLRLVEREGVTRLFLVPTMAPPAARPPRHRPPATCRRCARCRSAVRPSTPELLAEVEDAFGCEAICGYGMTESSPTLTRSLAKPGTRRQPGPAGHHRPADPRRRPPGARRRRRRGAVGRRRPSARSAPARTT